MLVAADESPNGKFASRLGGFIAGQRGLPMTVLEVAGKAEEESGSEPSLDTAEGRRNRERQGRSSGLKKKEKVKTARTRSRSPHARKRKSTTPFRRKRPRVMTCCSLASSACTAPTACSPRASIKQRTVSKGRWHSPSPATTRKRLRSQGLIDPPPVNQAGRTAREGVRIAAPEWRLHCHHLKTKSRVIVALHVADRKSTSGQSQAQQTPLPRWPPGTEKAVLDDITASAGRALRFQARPDRKPPVTHRCPRRTTRSSPRPKRCRMRSYRHRHQQARR